MMLFCVHHYSDGSGKRTEAEIQRKQQQTQIWAKESVERPATQAAQQSADILAAQAAVAPLKAKKKTRYGRAQKVVAEAADAETEKAAKLQTQAKLHALKHELLQQIMENRRLGDRIVDGERKTEEQFTLLAVKLNLQDKSSASGQDKVSDMVWSHDDKQVNKKPDEVLPKANDLVPIINMFYKDVYMGIGTCEFEEGRLAVATEAFKRAERG